MSEWQPIETAPKVQYVLLGFEHHPSRQGFWDGGAWVVTGYVTETPPHPTHWMPLPAPPVST